MSRGKKSADRIIDRKCTLITHPVMSLRKTIASVSPHSNKTFVLKVVNQVPQGVISL